MKVGLYHKDFIIRKMFRFRSSMNANADSATGLKKRGQCLWAAVMQLSISLGLYASACPITKEIKNGTHFVISLHMPKRHREQRSYTIAVALPQKSDSNSDSLQPGNEIHNSESKYGPGLDKGCGSGTAGHAAKKKKTNQKENAETSQTVHYCCCPDCDYSHSNDDHDVALVCT